MFLRQPSPVWSLHEPTGRRFAARNSDRDWLPARVCVSFVHLAAPSPASPAAVTAQTPVSLASVAPPSPTSLAAVVVTIEKGWACRPGTAPHTQAPFTFNLSHLALLHHLETGMATSLGDLGLQDAKDATSILTMVLNPAMSTPYLMDELLAFSALHLSTLQSDAAAKEMYHHQASELQTRALEDFNSAQIQINDNNGTSMFLFSSLLGLHSLFDAGSYHGDFTEFLDSFIQYLGLHRGVGTFIGQVWDTIRITDMKHIIAPIEAIDSQRTTEAIADPENVTSRLLNLLDSSSGMASSAHSKACREAVHSLQWVLRLHQALPEGQRTNIVPAWPIRISSEYIELLRQRRPEALVILAHWAVLLHRDRSFWVFGDTGRILIECIARYLGMYWDQWLVWPREALNIA